MEKNIKSLEEIYTLYKSPIYSYLYYQSGNNFTAEELTQEVFLKAFKGLSNYRGEASIKTWLFKIAHNLYINWQKKENKYEMVSIDDDLLNTIVSERDKPEELVLKHEKSKEIRNVLFKLKDEYRTVLILSDIEELSYAEIAETMGWSLPKVKVTIYRARIKFKSYFLEDGEIK